MHLSYIMRKPIDLIQKFRKDVVILKCWKKNVENIKEIIKKYLHFAFIYGKMNELVKKTRRSE